MEMDRPPTAAKFIQRFREAAPVPPDQRRRDRRDMEGDFWWTRSSEYDDSDIDGLEHGTGSPPQSDGTPIDHDHRDHSSTEAGAATADVGRPFFGSRQGEAHINNNVSKDAATKDARGQPDKEHHPIPDESLLVVSRLSPAYRGRPRLPFSGDDDGSLLQHSAGEAQVLGSVPAQPEHRLAGTTSGSSDNSVGVESGGDELAYLDARARTLLEQCRQLLAVPSNSGQVAIQPGLNPLSSSAGHTSPIVDSMGGFNREGLEKRAWTLLNNCEPLNRGTVPDRDGEEQSIRDDCSLHGTPAGPVEDHGRRRESQVDLDDDGTFGQAFLRMDVGERRAWPLLLGRNEDAMDESGCNIRHISLGEAASAKPTLSIVDGTDEGFHEGKISKCAPREPGREGPMLGRIRGLGVVSPTFTHEDSSTLMEPVPHDAIDDEIAHGSGFCEPAQVASGACYDDRARKNCTSAAPPWVEPSRLASASISAQEKVSSILSTSSGGHSWSDAAWLEDFPEDPVLVALLQYGHQIEAELERRGSLLS